MNRREPWEPTEPEPQLSRSGIPEMLAAEVELGEPIGPGIVALLEAQPEETNGAAGIDATSAGAGSPAMAVAPEPAAPADPEPELPPAIPLETREERLRQHTIPPTGNIRLNTEKEAAWSEQWKRKHSPKHPAFSVPANVPLARLNPDHPSVRVILDLEKQINGRVISHLKGWP